MDADHVLSRIRRIVETIQTDKYVRGDDAVDLAALVHKLDLWLKSGGALPISWIICDGRADQKEGDNHG